MLRASMPQAAACRIRLQSRSRKVGFVSVWAEGSCGHFALNLLLDSLNVIGHAP